MNIHKSKTNHFFSNSVTAYGLFQNNILSKYIGPTCKNTTSQPRLTFNVLKLQRFKMDK